MKVRIHQPRQELPVCIRCGIARGNSKGVPVYRYPLIRQAVREDGHATSKCIGSAALCDRCLVETGSLGRTQGRKRADVVARMTAA